MTGTNEEVNSYH